MVLLRVSEDSETGSRLSMLEVDVTSLAVRQAVVIELTAPCRVVQSHREGKRKRVYRLWIRSGLIEYRAAEFLGSRSKECTCRTNPLP